MKKLSIFVPALIGLTMAACGNHVPNSNAGLSKDYYSDMMDAHYAINSHTIRHLVDSLMRNDGSSTIADQHTHRHYRNQGDFIWIDRHGVDQRADTLLAYLRQVDKMGFDTRVFHVAQIESDLRRIRHLELGDGWQDANHVLARLEYRLTKSFLRYAAGQRFGYVNPTFVLNRLDSVAPNPYDTIQRPVRYRGLFDVEMQHAEDSFFSLALRQAKGDDDHGAGRGSLSAFLRDVQPKTKLYTKLEEKLNDGKLTREERAKTLVNMERCRWRQADSPDRHQKYVLVNIPSFHLLAIDRRDTLSMRIGCGAAKTKTPLLNSYIKRMDLNPKWFVPRSIIVKDMVRHAGNASYFASRNYYICDRATGSEVNPSAVSRDMLLSGQYGVVQRGGQGNALGRIIFRFDNNFSVFLHDTSSKGVFGREDRGVSHGCVRVEKPFELAKFLLNDKDEALLDRIDYSMTADSLADRSRVVGSVKVEPKVPLFITYYTLYPMAGGMASYPDVYGYDKVIYTQLKKYLR